MNVTAILQQIDAEIEQLQKAKAALLSLPNSPKKRGRPPKSVSISSSTPIKKRRTLSAEAKAKIAEAQRKRWAAQKKAAKKSGSKAA